MSRRSADGKIYAALGRANASNPNLQILRGAPTTNGITGDFANFELQMAALDQTNWVYTSGINPPFNSPAPGGSATDLFAGIRGSGANVGSTPASEFHRMASMSPRWTSITVSRLRPCKTASPTRALSSASSREPSPTPRQPGLLERLDARQKLPRDGLGRRKQHLGSQFRPGSRALLFSRTDHKLRHQQRLDRHEWHLRAEPARRQGFAGRHQPERLAKLYQQHLQRRHPRPIPGVFRISLATNNLTVIGAVTVSFVRGGTADYWTHYTINTNETPNGVTIGTNSVTFPAGLMPGGGNWYVDVKIIPTADPVSGPTYSFTVRLLSGATYTAVAPNSGNLAIINTGPQLLTLSAPAPATLAGMNRVIPNDQARFRITRTGDTQRPWQ